METEESNSDTIEVAGLGEITSPSKLKEQNKSKHETEDVPVPPECPVPGCNSKNHRKFSDLRGHFGNMNDAAHRSYGLKIDDYRDN